MTATTIELDCDTDAPGRARRWLREVLDAELEPSDRDVIEDAVLCVSELVTNAYQAGCTSVLARCWSGIDRIRLSVHDDAPGLPRREAPPASAQARGRGLQLVDALSRSWGVERPAHGKEVWLELARPTHASTAEHGQAAAPGQ